MTWELEQVKPIDCTMDDSGVYTVIHRVVTKETHKEYSGERVQVRVDVLNVSSNEPIRSFIGNGNDVRKTVVRFIGDFLYPMNHRFSREHVSYIGYEIARAESDSNYVQD